MFKTAPLPAPWPPPCYHPAPQSCRCSVRLLKSLKFLKKVAWYFWPEAIASGAKFSTCRLKMKAGWVRQAVQLRCRPEPELTMAEYNEWHSKVWFELQLLGFQVGLHRVVSLQRPPAGPSRPLRTAAHPPPPSLAATSTAGRRPSFPLLRARSCSGCGIEGGRVRARPSGEHALASHDGQVFGPGDHEHNGPLEHVMYIGDDRFCR